jgi:hypothetical protein
MKLAYHKLLAYISFNHTQSGQGLVEVIIALAIFALIAASIAGLAVGGFTGIQRSGLHIRAQAYAQEGLEAVRAIRDRAWNELIFSQSGVEIIDGQWVFKGEGTTDNSGPFTRTIVFTDICRDSNYDIVSCPGDFMDIHSTQVTVQVDWQTSDGQPASLRQTAYFTFWDAKEISEDLTIDFGDGTFDQTELSDTAGDGNGAVLLAKVPDVSNVEYLKPTAFDDVRANDWETENLAYDGSGPAESVTAATSFNPTKSDPGIVFHSWSAPGFDHSARTLYIRRSDDGCVDDAWELHYSIDFGNTWQSIETGLCGISQSNSLPIDIDPEMNLTQLKVKVVQDRQKKPDDLTIYIWDIWLEGSSGPYYETGIYISNPIYVPSPVTEFTSIVWEWVKTSPDCSLCNILMQIKTATDSGGSPINWSTTWSGPDGDDLDQDDYYTDSTGSLIHLDHNGDQWIRYRAIYQGDTNSTPVLNKVIINY